MGKKIFEVEHKQLCHQNKFHEKQEKYGSTTVEGEYQCSICFDKCQRKSLQVGEVIAEEGECCNAGCERGGRGRRRSWLITVTRTHHTALNAAPRHGEQAKAGQRGDRGHCCTLCLVLHFIALLPFVWGGMASIPAALQSSPFANSGSKEPLLLIFLHSQVLIVP